MDLKDGLIAAGMGAVKGYLSNAANESVKKEQERRNELLQLREMNKIRAKEQADIRLQKMKHDDKLQEQEGKNDLELGKLDKQHGYDLEVEGLKAGNSKAKQEEKDKAAQGKAVLSARDKLRERYQKVVSKEDAFSTTGPPPQFEVWAKSTYPELYAVAFPEGKRKDDPPKKGISSLIERINAGRFRSGNPGELPLMKSH